MLILAHGEHGHRREYLALFTRLIAGAGEPYQVCALSAAAILHPRVAFLPMLEERTIGFGLIALARALLGRRTVTCMFRPGEAVRSASTRHAVKRILFSALSRLSSVEVLTLLPFSIDQRFARVASGWIYDLPLWDWPPTNPHAPTSLADDVRSRANGRHVLIALGSQNRDKGFDFLARIWIQNPSFRSRFLVVAAGPVSAKSREIAAAFAAADGYLVDRFIEDEEMAGMFDVADLIWAAYSPDYDQASSIFGRSVQRGVPSVVRAGSYLVDLAAELGHPIVAAPWDEVARAAELIEQPRQRRPMDQVAPLVEEMRNRSVERLSSAFGIALNSADVL